MRENATLPDRGVKGDGVIAGGEHTPEVFRECPGEERGDIGADAGGFARAPVGILDVPECVERGAPVGRVGVAMGVFQEVFPDGFGPCRVRVLGIIGEDGEHALRKRGDDAGQGGNLGSARGLRFGFAAAPLDGRRRRRGCGDCFAGENIETSHKKLLSVHA